MNHGMAPATYQDLIRRVQEGFIQLSGVDKGINWQLQGELEEIHAGGMAACG